VSAAVRVDVFSDYLCPWCYNAAVRLREIEEAYGDRVRIHWRAFPVIPDDKPGRLATEQTRTGRARVAAEEPRACFVPPAVGTALPASSLPALVAARCAQAQGDVAFRRLHDRLFVAHFRDNLDIGRPEVLRQLAGECGLDLPRLERDYAAGEAYQAVLADYAEGAAWFGVSAIPAVIFDEKVSLVGAVPAERYRAILDWILAGEPGGLVPLPAEDAEAGVTRPGAPAG
jgi:predicted DsbA family dithiol-disulfide isomerase